MKRATLIINPCSGRGCTGEIAPAARHLLHTFGWEVDTFMTSARGDAVRMAAESAGHCDVIIAAGGDGTVNEVVTGICQKGCRTPVAIIPGGTANVVARELRLPRRLDELLLVAINGENRIWDLGVAENNEGEKRIFVMCAGAGLDGAIVAAVSRKRGKQGITMRNYYLPTASALRRYTFPAIRVTVDGDPREQAATFVIIGNLRRYGGPFAFFADADPCDGLLDVCCLRSHSRAKFIYYAMAAACRKSLRGMKNVEFYRGREITLSSTEKVMVQMDGDVGGHLPFRCRMLPAAVCFRSPGL